MTHIVAEPCINCKYKECVEVCPVDCFHEGSNMLYIDPDSCIDCELCVPECPVEAIFGEDDLPDKWKKYIGMNEEGSKIYPNINDDSDDGLTGILN